MQHRRNSDSRLTDSDLHRVSINGLPFNCIREPGGGEPYDFTQVAQQLTLVRFWTMHLSQGNERQEFHKQVPVAVGEPIPGRDRDEWKKLDLAAPEKRRGLRRKVFFCNHRKPLLTWLCSEKSPLFESNRLDGFLSNNACISEIPLYGFGQCEQVGFRDENGRCLLALLQQFKSCSAYGLSHSSLI